MIRGALSLPGLFAACCLVLVSLPVHAGADDAKLKTLFARAEAFEQQLDWDNAFKTYEEILRQDRYSVEARARYFNSLRRIWQVRRHREPGYRKEVLTLDYGQAVKLYRVVIGTLLDNSLDGKTVPPSAILHKGVEELSLALADPSFVQQYIPEDKTADVAEFREWLARDWTAATLTRTDLYKQMRDIALAGEVKLQLNATVAVMELACGACYAFDDYTAYLTPTQLREWSDTLRGEVAGVGLVLVRKATDKKLLVSDVTAYSAAALGGIVKDEQIVSVNKKPAADLTAEAALELLDGPAGTTVDVEVFAPDKGTRTVSLRRGLILLSVDYAMKDADIGYLNITCFQETTLQEVDDALANLGKNNMKALVLDLRGNTGGLFDVSVEVARRFLADGVVASKQNVGTTTIFHARNPAALGVPLVVLVDGVTASSAEVLAGALKENKRGRLVGQATFGKGCTQSIFKLPAAAGGVPTGGLRITVSRFLSPDGTPYTGHGVVPHLVIEPVPVTDRQLDEAILEARRLIEE